MRILRLPAPIHGLAFDIDNTLYTNADYAEHQEAVLIHRFALENGCDDKEAQYRIDRYRRNFALHNDGRKPSLGNTFADFGIPIAVSVRWRSELVQPERFLSVDAELQRSLAGLARRFALVVVTNNPAAVGLRTLAALGVDDQFLTIIGLDTTGVSKPHHKPFRLAARSCKLEPSVMVSIGDRPEIDLEPAMEIGMGGILVDSVQDVYALPEVLE